MTEEFKVLTDREHVLTRPGMYLGATVSEPLTGIINYKYQTVSIVPALVKMVDEIINNSIDEHVRTSGKFATVISVDVVVSLDGTEITVRDNGRGIPQEKINGTPRPVLAWTELRAGSNFDDSTRTSAGANGVGSSCTNVMSTSFIGTTCDGKNTMTVVCMDNMSSITWNSKKGGQQGTTVAFVPDMSRFGGIVEIDDHITLIRDRIINYAISYPGITFSFNGEKIHFKNIKQVAKQFHENSLFIEEPSYGIVIAPSGNDEEFRFVSYVNGICNKNGGSHIDFIVGRLVESVREHVKKKHKIDVLPNQIKQHLLVGIWARNFKALKFDSQTKDRITNTQGEISEYFGEINWDKLVKQLLNTPDIIDPMIQAILYKKEMQEKRELEKQQKQKKKVRVANHIAATGKIIEERILLITEGLSALGAIVETRNSSEFIGGYPLKGKVLNVNGMKPIDIIKNKEISELLAIIGLEIGKPATDLNYGKIAIMTDSDFDGAAICALLLNLFSLWPELFEKGKICSIKTPLYICTKGKDTKLFYTKEEFDNAKLVGYNVDYCKGLGSLPTNIYKECINNPKITVNQNTDNFDSLEMAFGPSADARKVWMLGE